MITNLLASFDLHSNIEVHEHTEMITRPHSVDGLVKGKLGGFDVAVRVRMRVPRTDEHVVDPPSMLGLTNDRLHLGARVWIVNIPGVTRTIASHRPSVVVVRTSPVDRLLTSEVADARRFGSRVEVASDDCRELAAVTSVEVAERDRLSLTGRLSFEPPRRRCRDEEELTNVWDWNCYRKRGPRDVRSIRKPEIEHLSDSVWPASRDRTSSIALYPRWCRRHRLDLMRTVEPGSDEKPIKLVQLRGLNDFLESNEIGGKSQQLAIEKFDTTKIACGVPGIYGKYSQMHGVS